MTAETFQDGENAVEVRQSTPVYTTFTSGTMEPLYCGDDAAAAAESLEMSEEQFREMLMGDGEAK